MGGIVDGLQSKRFFWIAKISYIRASESSVRSELIYVTQFLPRPSPQKDANSAGSPQYELTS